MAKWLFKRVDIPGTERIEAAKILVEKQGSKIAFEFLKLAKKHVVTPEDLRRAMAEMIVAMNDPKVNKRIVRLVGRGKPHERVFALLVTRHLKGAKLLKKIRRGLSDKSFAVRRAAAEVLAERGDRESLPDLRRLLQQPPAPEDLQVAIEAISRIEKGDATWLQQLILLSKQDDRDARNAALSMLANTKDQKFLKHLEWALDHKDWSTRLTAIRGIGSMHHKDAIPLLIGRLKRESGRMAREIANVLWNLTGLPYEDSHAKWQAWWEREGAKFAVISADDLKKAKKARELRRLKQRTVAGSKFFGIRTDSQRVIFIVDTSGSMTDPVHGRLVDGKRAATRIDVAKEELERCIKELAPESLFNIYSFSFGIARWLKKGIASASDHSREDAKTFIERLGAGGPTNLYDTLKMAFEDPDVDTLYVLSDGEPTAGAVLDPHQIRADVKFWNRHRNITIHTIAIGGNLEILEWLAADSGGKHVRMR